LPKQPISVVACILRNNEADWRNSTTPMPVPVTELDGELGVGTQSL
jgi:hypothetical protein